MIIREMPWEKRNLGVEAVSYQVMPYDKVEVIMPQVVSCKTEYQEMRIPYGNTDILLAAQAAGFCVVEMSIELQIVFDKKQAYLPEMYKRFRPHMTYSFADEMEFERIIEYVKSGEMFKTDKISNNPRFGQKAAGQRYAHWLRQIRENESVIVLLKYKGQDIGFQAFKCLNNEEYVAILGGTFPEYDGQGLGMASICAANEALISINAKKLTTHVSSNNLAALKCGPMSGFRIVDAEYILFKFSK